MTNTKTEDTQEVMPVGELYVEIARLQAYIEPVDEVISELSSIFIESGDMKDIQEGDGDSPADYRLAAANVLTAAKSIIDERDRLRAVIDGYCSGACELNYAISLERTEGSEQ